MASEKKHAEVETPKNIPLYEKAKNHCRRIKSHVQYSECRQQSNGKLTFNFRYFHNAKDYFLAPPISDSISMMMNLLAFLFKF